jgi:hypothetical protein
MKSIGHEKRKRDWNPPMVPRQAGSGRRSAGRGMSWAQEPPPFKQSSRMTVGGSARKDRPSCWRREEKRLIMMLRSAGERTSRIQLVQQSCGEPGQESAQIDQVIFQWKFPLFRDPAENSHDVERIQGEQRQQVAFWLERGDPQARVALSGKCRRLKVRITSALQWIAQARTCRSPSSFSHWSCKWANPVTMASGKASRSAT